MVGSSPDKAGTYQSVLPDGAGPASVTGRSTRGTRVYVPQRLTGSNLVDMGRVRCVTLLVPVCRCWWGELLGHIRGGGRKAPVKCCGVTGAMPQGQSGAPHPSSEQQ